MFKCEGWEHTHGLSKVVQEKQAEIPGAVQHSGLQLPQPVILESSLVKVQAVLASGSSLTLAPFLSWCHCVLQLPLMGSMCILPALLFKSPPPNNICIKKTVLLILTLLSLLVRAADCLLYQTLELWLVVGVGWFVFKLRLSHRKLNLPIKLHCSSQFWGLQIKMPNHLFNYINLHVVGIPARWPDARLVNK